MIRVVATGIWLYDGTVATTVRIVETDRDFWLDVAVADGESTDGEVPNLNERGVAYYLRLRPGWEPGQPFWPDSPGFMSLAEAKAAAESAVTGELSWS